MLQAHDALLSTDFTRFIPIPSVTTDQIAKLSPNSPASAHGAYMYCDAGRKKFIRTGKVGRPFPFRINEHHVAATKFPPLSHFYRVYPSKQLAAHHTSSTRRGFHEDLLVFIALGYFENRKTQVIDFFYWAEDVKNYVTKAGIKGANTLQDKQFQCVAYLIEMAYELLLAPADDVSTNPGFEPCLRIYGSS